MNVLGNRIDASSGCALRVHGPFETKVTGHELGLVSLFERTPYCKISKSFELLTLGFNMLISF